MNAVSDFIKSNQPADAFTGTELEGYCNLSPTRKGRVGEFIAKRVLLEEFPTADLYERDNTGHDFITTRSGKDLKVEVKFSASVPDSVYIFNHISISKDWDVVMFVTPSAVDEGGNVSYTARWCNKEAVAANAACTSPVFRHQQGGRKGNNDDFMAAVYDLQELTESRPLSELGL